MKVELHCIASVSAGNGFILTAGSERLVLECGVKVEVLLEALEYNVQNINVLFLKLKEKITKNLHIPNNFCTFA